MLTLRVVKGMYTFRIARLYLSFVASFCSKMYEIKVGIFKR